MEASLSLERHPRKPHSRKRGPAAPGSERREPHLSRPDPDHLLEIRDEDLPVTDLPFRPRTDEPYDRIDHAVDLVVVDGNLELHLRDELDPHLAAPVDLGVPALPAHAPDARDGHAVRVGRRDDLLD